MKTMSSVMTRRDRCYLIGRRGLRLTSYQAVKAWFHLADQIERMGDKDVPRFNDLLIAFEVAAVKAKGIRFPRLQKRVQTTNDRPSEI